MKKLRDCVRELGLVAMLSLTPPTIGCTGPQDYSSYYNNSYNIRLSMQGKNPLTNNNVSTIQKSGTAFVIKKGIKSYFITAKHVVVPTITIIPEEHQSHIERVSYTIGTDRNDMNLNDDYVLSLVAVDNKYDLALFEYTANTYTNEIMQSVKWIESPHRNVGEENLGNHVFTVGYKLNMEKTLDEGIVSSKRHSTTDSPEYFWTTIDSMPGVSGAPIYEVDNGAVELIGVALRISPTGADTLVIPISIAQDLLKRYLKNPGTERDNLKKVMGDYYKYIDK